MNKYIVTIVALLASCVTLSARNDDSFPIKIDALDVSRQGDKMNVGFILDLSAITLKKNEQIIYTPVLTSADGGKMAALGKIVVSGKNAYIVDERSPKNRVEGAIETVRRKNGTEQLLRYTTAAPYSAWMDDAILSLAEDLCGCGDLQSQNLVELTHVMNNLPMVTDAIFATMEPEVEEPKIRHEKGSAYVDFIVNRFDIQPSYHNNRAEIGKIISSIDLVRNDKNVEITNITIHGYASPEGPYSHNAYLAENRTKALIDYVKQLYPISGNLFSVASTPENWDGLREFVANSTLNERQRILNLIDDNTLTPDYKESQIKANYPDAYAVIMKDCYPMLRKSDYVISYIVRPFTAEEALEVMKTAPQQVSLHEMFWAAQSLGVNSKGYNEIIDLAVRTYPDEPVANYNAAIVAVNQGNNEAALQYINKVPESAKTQNVRGVIALNKGDYEAARRYFQNAVAQGMPEAAKSIEMIDRLNARNKQNR